ncbi:MAG: gliding motility protein GldN [Saprospiraceae bacterium]|nr:gliding motility protein GldN [Saprospiraceae bacterium]HMS67966.1 gliding motility protein GldN [Saprospiraceae bacterium]
MNNKLIKTGLASFLCLGGMMAVQAQGVTNPAPTTPSTPTTPQITESSVPSEDIYIDDIVPRRMITESVVLPYEPIREADIAWEKRFWRIVDTREKINLAWRAEEMPFFNILKDLISNGDITAFDDEKFKTPLGASEVEGKLFKIDTIPSFDYDTYQEKIEVVKNTLDWRNIKKFRIKEIWFFDEQASVLKNRILGIAPIMEEVVEGLDRPLEYPLFWIYYPEARELLAKKRVMNDDNDMAPMSWADLIDNRFFSSVIYKRSNILDYRVEDYFDPKSDTANMDVLLQSEKIKEELFNFEHDLWEY